MPQTAISLDGLQHGRQVDCIPLQEFLLLLIEALHRLRWLARYLRSHYRQRRALGVMAFDMVHFPEVKTAPDGEPLSEEFATWSSRQPPSLSKIKGHPAKIVFP